MVSSRTVSAYKYTTSEGSKFCYTYIFQNKKDLAVHVQMDSQATLAYLVKMKRTRNLLMIKEAKKTWAFCLANQITLNAEYLPGTLNTRAERLPGK